MERIKKSCCICFLFYVLAFPALGWGAADVDSASAPRGLDVLLISTDVKDFSTLAESVPSDAEFIFFDPLVDPPGHLVFKMLSLCKERGDSIRSLSILSAGRAGVFAFGNVELDTTELQTHSEVLRPLHTVFSSLARVYIYSGETGSGAEGAKLLKLLTQCWKVPIEASTNVTGQDGDWLLEVSAGPPLKGKKKVVSARSVLDSEKLRAIYSYNL